jgi:hypothetical protein
MIYFLIYSKYLFYKLVLLFILHILYVFTPNKHPTLFTQTSKHSLNFLTQSILFLFRATRIWTITKCWKRVGS